MIVMILLASVSTLMLGGCATHADFLEVREQLSKISRSHEQDRQRVDGELRRLQSVEPVKDTDSGKQRFDEVASRLQKIEGRLAKLEESVSQTVAKTDHAISDPRPPKLARQTQLVESATASAAVQGITPTAAFNLAYNDYLNAKYELAAAGFQRFAKDFPGSSLAPNAQYWLGESYYNLKDYGRATQTFEFLVAEYPGNEKTPAALYKLGLATAEMGDLTKSRKNLKRVVEEFPASDESRLAKNKLAEIR